MRQCRSMRTSNCMHTIRNGNKSKTILKDYKYGAIDLGLRISKPHVLICCFTLKSEMFSYSESLESRKRRSSAHSQRTTYTVTCRYRNFHDYEVDGTSSEAQATFQCIPYAPATNPKTLKKTTSTVLLISDCASASHMF